MNVAFLFLHPFSGSLGSSVRVRELSISLSKLGVSSHILSPYEKDRNIGDDIFVKNIPSIAGSFGLSSWMYKLSRLAYYNKSLVRRFLTSKRFQDLLANNITRNAFKVFEESEIDIVQAEQDIAVPTSLKLADKIKVPVVADLHNIIAEELVAADVVAKDSTEFRALQRLTAESLSQVDLVVVVSDEMKEYVSSEYDVSKSDIVVVPPGGQPRIQEVKERAYPPKVVYAGLVGYREHVDLFVESMPMILKERADVKFFVTKKGEKLRPIRALARRLKVHPEYFWYSIEEEFYRFLASCHVGALPSTNDLARKMGTPVKLFDYMSVGLPVVANDVRAWTDIIERDKVGFITCNDPYEFGHAIVELINSPELSLEFGRRGLELVRSRYNWERSAATLANEYEKLLTR